MGGSIIGDRSNVGFTNEITMGVQWGYEWNHVYSKTHDIYSATFPYQVVNDVRSSRYVTWNIGIEGGCPGAGWLDQTPAGQVALRACIADIAHARPSSYWMIWNEPDDISQDGLTPLQGAQYFTEISNTILTADPTARLIVGNVGSRYFGQNPPPPYNVNPPCAAYCGVDWMSAFVTAFMTSTNGATPYGAISGYGFHAYGFNDAPGDCPGGPKINSTPAIEQCLIDNWTSIATRGVNWVLLHDPNAGAKEIWLTEINWYYPKDTPGWDIQVARMNAICAVLPTLPIKRYGWFFGLSDLNFEKASLFSAPFTGALSPAGVNFTDHCSN